MITDETYPAPLPVEPHGGASSAAARDLERAIARCGDLATREVLEDAYASSVGDLTEVQ